MFGQTSTHKPVLSAGELEQRAAVTRPLAARAEGRASAVLADDEAALAARRSALLVLAYVAAARPDACASRLPQALRVVAQVAQGSTGHERCRNISSAAVGSSSRRPSRI